MEQQHGFAAVNDTSLSYEITGTGSPVVFIHGGGGAGYAGYPLKAGDAPG
jgi:pimeloyl-ACP methyl ester carboxylesterase